MTSAEPGPLHPPAEPAPPLIPEPFPAPPSSSTGPPPGPDGGPPEAGPYRLRRSTSDRMVAGVCGGLGAAVGVDPLWFRLAVLVLAFGSGSGVLLYLAAWILMPEETEAVPVRRHPELHAARGSLLAGAALVAVGTLLLINRLVPWFDQMLWPLAVIGAGAGLLYAGSRR